MRAGFASLKLNDASNPEDGSTSANHASKTAVAGAASVSPMPTLDGSDALAWLARAEQYFLIFGTTPENRVGLAMVALAGEALPWYQLLRHRVPDLPWARFARELMKHFGGTGALNEYEAFAAVRHTGSLAEFVAAFEARLAQVPDISCQQYLGFFMAALRPEVRLQVKAAKITTYEDAVEMALDLDIMASAQPQRPAPSQATVQTHSYQSHATRSATKGYSPNPSYSTASSKPISKRFRNVSPEEYRRHIAAGTCVKCGLKFGPAHRCPPRTLNVMICDDNDYSAADSKPDDAEVVETGVEPQLSALSLNGLDTANTMKLFGAIASHSVKVMVDSGANYCFISDQCALRLELSIMPTSPYSVVLGDGSTRRASGICHDVPLKLLNEEFVVSCYVFPLRNIDVILGVAWLASLGYVMANWQRSSMDFRVHGRPVSLKGDPSLMRRACSTRDLRCLKEGDYCWVLCAMEQAATAEPFEMDSALSPSARSQLLGLIGEFPAITRDAVGLPPRRRTDHRIPLIPGTNPVSVRPYRYNHLQKDEMEKLVVEMLSSGVIQPSTSPFSSPELNKRTVPDKYPIPVIQELLDELHGAKWFSKIVLKAGYHQIQVANDDVSKTAFRTHSGHYEFLVMPFGLTNAPATFQSLMNDIFRLALRKFVLVFFDDILVYSATWADHMRHLRQVFEALNAHALVVNAKKCLLGRASVEYLGHIMSFEGVKMDPAKVSAVLRWPTPTSLKSIRGFLGLTGYYRRFIKDYSKIAAPLTELLKKQPTPPPKVAWNWTPAAAAVFEALKSALTSAPLLKMPDFTKEFVIECDASGRGIGAVLMQDRQPVAYFSKTLSSRWLAKSAYEKELMALVLAIHH
ncbi:uncharacterized protein LOC121749458 [Salvia splendens]|uniref:uncharacterized protein LOC121749458 n=1 Tax=Salvia splendens TaxID=180675 RepID=UPI001C25319D|nr:uncharacterized protein LOC121749458 [Salvia splendens]